MIDDQLHISRSRLISTLALVVFWFATPAATVSSQDSSSPADAPAAPQWEGPLLDGPVSNLITFANGTMLAQQSDNLQRSEDGGQNWSAISLPPAGPSDDPSTGRPGPFGLLGADPGNARILFATGAAPLYKSSDAGTTWKVVLTAGQLDGLKKDSIPSREPDRRGQGFHSLAVAVSPADRNRVYAEIAWRGAYAPYGLYESSDGGETWILQQKVTYASLCHVSVAMLMPHPTNPQRLFRETDCLAARNFGSLLTQSFDEGRTFHAFWEVPDADNLNFICRGMESTYGFAHALVGGAGSAPHRWYLAVNRAFGFGGSTVLRSEDDGSTWQEILAYRGGGSGQLPCTEAGDWNVRIAGLAYDSDNPDRLYVARIATDPHAHSVISSGVTMTPNGGITWTDLASQQMGSIAALALGPDSASLYAATDQGVWRLDVSQVQ